MLKFSSDEKAIFGRREIFPTAKYMLTASFIACESIKWLFRANIVQLILSTWELGDSLGKITRLLVQLKSQMNFLHCFASVKGEPKTNDEKKNTKNIFCKKNQSMISKMNFFLAISSKAKV